MIELLSRLEALLITLLAALGVGAVAVMASAVPSMFASDADTRCWSSAVAVGSLWLAEQLVILSAVVIGAFALSRLFRSWFRQIPRKWRGPWRILGEALSKLVGWVLRVLGAVLVWGPWAIGALFGAMLWTVVLHNVEAVLATPPALPPDRDNRAACDRLIVDMPLAKSPVSYPQEWIWHALGEP
jgi:hypothetical protein